MSPLKSPKFSFRAYPSQVWLLLLTSFIFGLSQAVVALVLNFYLRALGLGAEWQGLVNALPALTLAVTSLPLVFLARRLSNARVLQLGALLLALPLLALLAPWVLRCFWCCWELFYKA